MVFPGSVNDAAHKRTKGIYGHSAIHILEGHILNIDISRCYLSVVINILHKQAVVSLALAYMNTGNFSLL